MNIIMAVNMGGDDFVPKPFDLSVLTAKVQRYFAEHTTCPEKYRFLSIRSNTELE